MRIAYTDTAKRQLASQINYVIDQGATAAARRLRTRVTSYITTFIARHPRAARYIPDRDLYETWIPRTPYVVLYRFEHDQDRVIILALFHSAQDRSSFQP